MKIDNTDFFPVVEATAEELAFIACAALEAIKESEAVVVVKRVPKLAFKLVEA